jgi:hypothetical protein
VLGGPLATGPQEEPLGRAETLAWQDSAARCGRDAGEEPMGPREALAGARQWTR